MTESAFDDAWVPAAFLPGYDDYCPIQRVYGESNGEGLFEFSNPYAVSETNPNGYASIPNARVINEPGFLVLELGTVEEDYTRETTAKAIHSSLFSLFAACSPNVQFERIRTSLELTEVMKQRGHQWSHIVIVGHGGEDGLRLLDCVSSVSGEQLGGMLAGSASARSTQIISLCCHSGCSLVSKALSRNENVTEVIAPNDVFDMRWAVVFVSGYFLKLFQSTAPVETAVANAAAWCEELPMVVWRDGVMVSGSEE